MKSKSYEEFVEKFKPKLTTDDCYTPPAIYEVIRDWACNEFKIDPAVIVRPFYPGGDYEHYDIARKMSEGRSPERESRHEHHIDNHRHHESGHRYPYCHVRLARELVPHRDIEQHPEEHVGQEHYRHHAHSGTEILAEDEGENIKIQENPEQNQAAECGEEVHDNGIELPGAFVPGPLEEERLGREPEHLDEKVHYHGQFDSRLEYSEAGAPCLRIRIEIAEEYPVEEVVDYSRQGRNHQRY